MLGIIRLTPGVRNLLILVACGWVLDAFVPRDLLADIPSAVMTGEVWRLVTYPFAAGLNVFTLLGAICFAAFASSVEEVIGTNRFHRLFWGATLLGGGLSLLTGVPLASLMVPNLAIITAFCLLNWEATIYSGHFLLMIPIKAKYLLLVEALFVVAMPRPMWLPMFAAMALGYLMIQKNWFMAHDLVRKAPAPRRKTRLGDDFSGAKVTPLRPTFTKGPVSQLEAEVDVILDKLRVEGMASLTPEEKEVLDRNSRRLRHGDERG